MKSIFIKSSWIFLVIFAFSSTVFAQWSSDFTSSDLSEWMGDVDQFIINEDNQLQLMAADAGETTIFRNSQINADSLSIGLFHVLDFAPSDNNRSTIYLGLDNQDLSIANGYYMQIGENGSEDAIKFYYLDNGFPEQIATATMGAMSSEPATVRIQIDIFLGGLWSVKTNYNGLESLSLDLDFMDNRFSFADSQFFGMTCKFSASRADKFFYDDMFIKAFEVDTTPPAVVEAVAQSANQILIRFDEPVEMIEAQNVANYQVNNGVGNPISVSPVGSLGNEYLLQYGSDFASDIEYSLIVSGINDLNGNQMTDFSFLFNVPSQPLDGEVLISEILFDPYSGGEDFVEIYNTTEKFLDLNGISIVNAQNEMQQTVTDNIILAPNSYLALSEDTDFLIQEYKPDPQANISFAELPSFNNDEGNITILTSTGIVLDSFDYSDEFHLQLIDDIEGVSLERVSFEIETNNSRNWQSASQNARFATPGYKNSSSVSIDPGSEMFAIATETFSPNQDGADDIMILNYNLDRSGYVANISVHDAAGYKIRDLSQNELLSTQGIITWDGTNIEGNISNLGIYIVVGRVFHPDGEVLEFKKTTVLADFID